MSIRNGSSGIILVTRKSADHWHWNLLALQIYSFETLTIIKNILRIRIVRIKSGYLLSVLLFRSLCDSQLCQQPSQNLNHDANPFQGCKMTHLYITNATNENRLRIVRNFAEIDWLERILQRVNPSEMDLQNLKSTTVQPAFIECILNWISYGLPSRKNHYCSTLFNLIRGKLNWLDF